MRHPNVQRRIRAAKKRESRLFYELRRRKREAAAEKPRPVTVAPDETPAGWLGAVMLVAVTAILVATVTCAILFS